MRLGAGHLGVQRTMPGPLCHFWFSDRTQQAQQELIRTGLTAVGEGSAQTRARSDFLRLYIHSKSMQFQCLDLYNMSEVRQ